MNHLLDTFGLLAAMPNDPPVAHVLAHGQDDDIVGKAMVRKRRESVEFRCAVLRDATCDQPVKAEIFSAWRGEIAVVGAPDGLVPPQP